MSRQLKVLEDTVADLEDLADKLDDIDVECSVLLKYSIAELMWLYRDMMDDEE